VLRKSKCYALFFFSTTRCSISTNAKLLELEFLQFISLSRPPHQSFFLPQAIIHHVSAKPTLFWPKHSDCPVQPRPCSALFQPIPHPSPTIPWPLLSHSKSYFSATSICHSRMLDTHRGTSDAIGRPRSNHGF